MHPLIHLTKTRQVPTKCQAQRESTKEILTSFAHGVTCPHGCGRATGGARGAEGWGGPRDASLVRGGNDWAGQKQAGPVLARVQISQEELWLEVQI